MSVSLDKFDHLQQRSQGVLPSHRGRTPPSRYQKGKKPWENQLFLPMFNMVIGLETSKSTNRNLVPSPNTKNHLLSLSELADRTKISTFGTFAEKHFSATFLICLLINAQDCSMIFNNINNFLGFCFFTTNSIPIFFVRCS